MLSFGPKCSGHLVRIHYYILPGRGPVVRELGSSVRETLEPARRLEPVTCCQVLCLDVLVWVCSSVPNIQRGGWSS